MRYRSNSQDVIWNSRFCSGAWGGFQQGPSVTEIPAYFPAERWELQRCSLLRSHDSSCTVSLGCDWMGGRQARRWQELSVVPPEYLPFSPVFFLVTTLGISLQDAWLCLFYSGTPLRTLQSSAKIPSPWTKRRSLFTWIQCMEIVALENRKPRP